MQKIQTTRPSYPAIRGEHEISEHIEADVKTPYLTLCFFKPQIKKTQENQEKR